LTKGNVEVAQRLSGHKDIRTTAGYNKLTDEGKDEAISLFDKALQ
jgi:site-specific recombinase XerD